MKYDYRILAALAALVACLLAGCSSSDDEVIKRYGKQVPVPTGPGTLKPRAVNGGG